MDEEGLRDNSGGYLSGVHMQMRWVLRGSYETKAVDKGK